MSNINAILDERQHTHGDYTEHARITQQTKDVWRHSDGWERLDACQRETLEMIAHKVGRILAGSPVHKDHWDDIAGYSVLVSNRITAAFVAPLTARAAHSSAPRDLPDVAYAS